MKKKIFILLSLAMLIIITGCAHSYSKVIFANGEHIYGFWAGTLHGMICFFSFIASFFDNSIKIYAVNNNGHWYDFGFIGGLSMIIKAINNLLKK